MDNIETAPRELLAAKIMQNLSYATRRTIRNMDYATNDVVLLIGNKPRSFSKNLFNEIKTRLGD